MTLLKKLIKLQKKEGYLKEKSLQNLSQEINIPLVKIYETASFYSFLSTKPQGKYIIRICSSPSCFLNGQENLVAIFKKLLKIDVEKTTEDGLFSLTLTSCIGCCDKPPAAMINDILYTELSEKKVKEILAKCK